MSTSTKTDIPQALTDVNVEPLSQTSRPNNCIVTKVQTKLFTWLAMIPKAGQIFGYAWIICRPGTQDWNIHTNNAPAVVAPIDPGPLPQIPPGTNAFDERRLVREHESQRRMCTTYRNAVSWFHSKIVKICGVYIEALRHEITGYTNVAPHQFFTHLLPLMEG